MKMRVEEDWNQYWPLGYKNNNWLPTILHANDERSLAVQPVFNQPHCLLIHQLLFNSLTGGSAKSLSEV